MEARAMLSGGGAGGAIAHPFSAFAPGQFVDAGGTTFFVARDAVAGIELWKTDGTAAGTGLVKDTNPGGNDALLSELTASRGRLYFFSSGFFADALWTSDGTEAGTVPLKTVPHPSPGVDVGARTLTDVGGTLFFTTANPVEAGGVALWKSDGTPGGTVQIKTFAPPPAGAFASELTNVGGTLFFRAYDPAAGVELWKSDGTSAGTVRVKDVEPGAGGSYPHHLTPFGARLYFSTTSGLWTSDGTPEATTRVGEPAGSTATLNGALYITPTVAGLWKSDGTTGGTGVVTYDPRGSQGDLIATGNRLFFSTYDGASAPSWQLWTSDGTAAGTTQLTELGLPTEGFSFVSQLTGYNGAAYFVADDAKGSGAELWTSDGTPAGTRRLTDIVPGAGAGVDRFYGYLTAAGGKLYFRGGDMQPWVVDGAAGPRPLGGVTAVVSRHIFYNRSSFDGDSAAANAADDGAIATDKNALLASQDRLPGFDNVTSYDKGINGVMIDIDKLPVINALLDADDFDFGPAGAPVSVTVRPGAGVNGSDRVTLIWRDYNPLDASPLPQAVGNGWLTVTVKANGHTGLKQPDVFSFGNLIAETGDGAGGWRVNAQDLAAVKRALNAAAPVTSKTDFNRDGRTNAQDLAMVKRNLNHSLDLFPTPSTAPLFADGGRTPTRRVAESIL